MLYRDWFHLVDLLIICSSDKINIDCKAGLFASKLAELGMILIMRGFELILIVLALKVSCSCQFCSYSLAEALCGLQTKYKSFDDLRKQVKEQWDNLPPYAESISPELKKKTEEAVKKLQGKSQLVKDA